MAAILSRKWGGQRLPADSSQHFQGWFEFRLCANNNIHQAITQACLDQYLLRDVSGSNRQVLVSFCQRRSEARMMLTHDNNKQRFLTPGHQGWNDLHSLCRIGMEYYLLNNDDNNIIYWIIMIIMIMMMIIIMMTMMIIGTATIMIMIIIITTTLTMTIMKMIMIKTAQTPCQSLYKDRRI